MIDRVNPAGWAENDTITPDQITRIDANTAKAPDLAAGGTYSPVSPFLVEGSGYGGILNSERVRMQIISAGTTLTNASAAKIILTSAAGTPTIYLPAAPDDGRHFSIVCVVSGNFNVGIHGNGKTFFDTKSGAIIPTSSFYIGSTSRTVDLFYSSFLGYWIAEHKAYTS